MDGTIRLNPHREEVVSRCDTSRNNVNRLIAACCLIVTVPIMTGRRAAHSRCNKREDPRLICAIQCHIKVAGRTGSWQNDAAPDPARLRVRTNVSPVHRYSVTSRNSHKCNMNPVGGSVSEG